MPSKGYTLLELLVVIVIFGILASLAMVQWSFSAAKPGVVACQYKTRANNVLRAILAAEHSYRLGNGSFTNDLTKLPVSDVNARSATDYPVTYNIGATTADVFDGQADYTSGGTTLTLMQLQYDAIRADEPRESIPVEAICP